MGFMSRKECVTMLAITISVWGGCWLSSPRYGFVPFLFVLLSCFVALSMLTVESKTKNDIQGIHKQGMTGGLVKVFIYGMG
ncbi:hypothetical protein B0T21DRAFT_356385 [Apiosordaria backusii]|uniref:Uncharacterized protein n=1 Tax=Apiosordaria backusii TaxID=314023 RepID=A0AA40K703_9PEZI|nr:hypothetical protein B0T21DRAFT_356385 [Apiosordaria backusii]